MLNDGAFWRGVRRIGKAGVEAGGSDEFGESAVVGLWFSGFDRKRTVRVGLGFDLVRGRLGLAALTGSVLREEAAGVLGNALLDAVAESGVDRLVQ